MQRNGCPQPIGATVGAWRWPQPLTPERAPWRGTVLALNDVRAWAYTAAFSRGEPSSAEVDEHVARLIQRGLLSDKVPVLWEFGGQRQVLWERWGEDAAHPIRAYAEDVAQWREAVGENEQQARQEREDRQLWPRQG